MFHRLFVAYLLLVLAITLQLQFKSEWGTAPDFILAAIFVFAFALDFWELLPVLLFGGWLLNWQPFIGQELIYLIFLAFAAFLLRRLIPWQPWLGVAVYAVGGALCFYLLSGLLIWRLVSAAFIFFDALAVLFFGWLTFAVLRAAGHRRTIQSLF